VKIPRLVINAQLQLTLELLEQKHTQQADKTELPNDDKALSLAYENQSPVMEVNKHAPS
jgi:hypothetical protein